VATPLAPLFAFASPDAAAAWQAVNDGVMGGVSDGGRRVPCGLLVQAGVGSVTGA